MQMYKNAVSLHVNVHFFTQIRQKLQEINTDSSSTYSKEKAWMLVVSSRGIKLLWVFRLIHVREYEFWISGNFCSSYPDTQQIVAGESWILGFGIRNTAQGIHNSTIDRIPESKFYWQRFRNPRRGIQIQDCLGFLYLGRFRWQTLA